MNISIGCINSFGIACSACLARCSSCVMDRKKGSILHLDEKVPNEKRI